MKKIGVVLRYSNLKDGRDILYLGEKVRRTFQKAGCFIIPIVQVQDVNYNSTRWNEFDEILEKEKEIIDEYLNMVDGVIFPGGFKLTPYDKYVLDRCVELDKRVLGICLGMQLVGSYNRDINIVENDSIINHVQDGDDYLSHKVKINKNSKLYEILGEEEILVNSFHKRHIEDVDSELVINAISEDGIIEGVEFPNNTFIMGVQWHPEISYDFDDNSKKIIDYFINICGK